VKHAGAIISSTRAKARINIPFLKTPAKFVTPCGGSEQPMYRRCSKSGNLTIFDWPRAFKSMVYKDFEGSKGLVTHEQICGYKTIEVRYSTEYDTDAEGRPVLAYHDLFDLGRADAPDTGHKRGAFLADLCCALLNDPELVCAADEPAKPSGLHKTLRLVANDGVCQGLKPQAADKKAVAATLGAYYLAEVMQRFRHVEIVTDPFLQEALHKVKLSKPAPACG